jgi:hypothetical protein
MNPICSGNHGDLQKPDIGANIGRILVDMAPALDYNTVRFSPQQ